MHALLTGADAPEKISKKNRGLHVPSVNVVGTDNASAEGATTIGEKSVHGLEDGSTLAELGGEIADGSGKMPDGCQWGDFDASLLDGHRRMAHRWLLELGTRVHTCTTFHFCNVRC